MWPRYENGEKRKEMDGLCNNIKFLSVISRKELFLKLPESELKFEKLAHKSKQTKIKVWNYSNKQTRKGNEADKNNHPRK
jgi:hypothetical protein